MSDSNKRKHSARQTDQKSKLLEDLDSLKELLLEQKRHLESAQAGIPILNEIVESAPEEADVSIPVLEEVAFPPEEGALATDDKQPSRNAAATLPNEQELRKLIDLLVTHRLHRLKPKITEEIIEELQRLKPELFRRQGK